MLRYLTLILLFITIACNSKKEPANLYPTPADVQKAMKEINESALKYRREIAEVKKKYNNLKSLEEEALWKKQDVLDSINMDKIEAIIAYYGYPGKALVGDTLKTLAASIIMQNPKRQAPYVGLLWKAARAGEIKLMDAAFLEDRVLMFSGKKQKYGTSMKIDTVSLDPNTKMAVTRPRIWPIENPKIVDSLRMTIVLYPLIRQCEIMNIDTNSVQGYKFDQAALLRMRDHMIEARKKAANK